LIYIISDSKTSEDAAFQTRSDGTQVTGDGGGIIQQTASGIDHFQIGQFTQSNKKKKCAVEICTPTKKKNKKKIAS
jgi:hypothetical protein